MVAILAYLGMSLSEMYLYYGGNQNFKFLSFFLIFFNSLMIYWISYDGLKDGKKALSISLLYIISPLHLDSLIFPFQFYAILAESLALISFIFFYKKKIKLSVLFFIVACCFNLKFIAFIPFLIALKEVKTELKIILISLLISASMILAESFFQRSYVFNDQISGFTYYLNNLLFPFSLGILNLSFLVPNSIQSIQLLIMVALIGWGWIYYLKRKSEFLFILLAVFSFTLMSFFLPDKNWGSNQDVFFYLRSSLYPGITWSILLLIFYSLKNESKPYKWLLAPIFLGVLWGGGILYWQVSFQTPLGAWQHSISQLPSSFNHEKTVKLKYARVLIDFRRYLEAKLFIVENRSKFPAEEWYAMLLEIAQAENNQNDMNQIYQDLKSDASLWKELKLINK